MRGAAVALLVATWPVLWFARVHALPGLASVLIPAFGLMVLASVIAWGHLGSPLATRLVQVGFALIAAGDGFINLTPWPAAAAPSFIGAHLCLAVAFTRERGLRWRDLPWLFPPALAVLAFAHAELPRVSDPGRAAVLVVYLLALSAMVWRALCSAAWGAKGAARVIGAALFLATDLCVMAELVDGSRAHAGWIWAMYPPALLGLAWSCWERHPSNGR